MRHTGGVVTRLRWQERDDATRTTYPTHLGAAVDTATLEDLDATIRRKGQSLARLVLKRLTHAVKATFPEARTVRLAQDANGAYVVTRVTTHHNKTIWRRANDEDLAKIFGEAATQLAADAAHYYTLAGARLHLVRANKGAENAEYSVHLLRNVD